jgi:hypothetical protein
MEKSKANRWIQVYQIAGLSDKNDQRNGGI